MVTINGCSSVDSPAKAYRVIGAKLNKDYKLSGSDLIVSYDLGKIDNTNCIYAQDLGIILNMHSYHKTYFSKFDARFKSASILKKEAMHKVVRIYKLLLNLHKKYNILSNNDYQYVKRISKADLLKIDSRKELMKLDNIIKHIPVMLPEHATTISSHYGTRHHPIKGKAKFHCGIDLYSKISAPVFAAADGMVVFAGNSHNGYGNIVDVNHGNGIQTRYAHLKKTSVRKGQKIVRGQMIGFQGSTGSTTGEHLHYEIHIKGKHINPYDFISHACICQR